MKILIAYASKNGTVAICAQELKKHLQNLDVHLSDLAKEDPNPEEYDIVLMGASVRFGKLLSPLTKFWGKYWDVLLTKSIGLFFCCGYTHDHEYYYDMLLPEKLKEKAFQTLFFGGSLKKDGLSFFDKLVVRSMRSSIAETEIDDGEFTPSMPGILPENIERMATYTRLEISKIREK